MNQDTLTLAQLGWSHFFQQQVEPDELTFTPARVWRQDVNQYHLMSTLGALTGTLPGRFRQQALSKADLPTVGDWVLVSTIEGGEAHHVQIERLLDRKSRFSRKEAGENIDEQVVAANIDTVFIVNGLDDDYNPKRIERYLLLSWDSGAMPVIVLNKADLCEDLDARLDELRPIARDAPVHVVSAIESDGLEQLTPYFSEGTTCALMGSSGVGKSTLINALLGYEKFETNTVREGDSKGRHTTTFREMVAVPGGGLIIDTPGMRELQVWNDTASLSQAFEDIEALALNCKFTDCRHDSEPGCAVKQAISDGDLGQDRLQRYEKLQRELEHFDALQDATTRAEKKLERKRFARLIRNQPDKRD